MCKELFWFKYIPYNFANRCFHHYCSYAFTTKAQCCWSMVFFSPSGYLLNLSNPFALCIIFQFRKKYQYVDSCAENTFYSEKSNGIFSHPIIVIICLDPVVNVLRKLKSWGKKVRSSTGDTYIVIIPGLMFSI